MTAPDNEDTRTRHPTLWTVEAVRWEFREHDAEYEGSVAHKHGLDPGVQMGQRIDRAEVPDRPFAVAVAHHFLDRYSDEAAGRMSLEIHVHPPERDLHDESAFVVLDEVLEQARKLGIEGDVEGQVKRMARDATPFTHAQANRRFERFLLRLEGNVVAWLGLAEPPRGRRKTR